MNSFPMFSDLPPELRHHIWTLACEQHASSKLIIVYPRLCPLANPNLLSPILSVNRESRQLANLFYPTKVAVWSCVIHNGGALDVNEWRAYRGQDGRQDHDHGRDQDDDDNDDMYHDYDDQSSDSVSGHSSPEVYCFFKGILYLNLSYSLVVIGARTHEECPNPVYVDRRKLGLRETLIPGRKLRPKPEPVLCTQHYLPHSNPLMMRYWWCSFSLDLGVQAPGGDDKSTARILGRLATRAIAIHVGDFHCAYCVCQDGKQRDMSYTELKSYLGAADKAPSERDWSCGYFDRMRRIGYDPPRDRRDDNNGNSPTAPLMHLNLTGHVDKGVREGRAVIEHAEFLGPDWFMARYDLNPILYWKPGTGYVRRTLMHEEDDD